MSSGQSEIKRRQFSYEVRNLPNGYWQATIFRWGAPVEGKDLFHDSIEAREWAEDRVGLLRSFA